MGTERADVVKTGRRGARKTQRSMQRNGNVAENKSNIPTWGRGGHDQTWASSG